MENDFDNQLKDPILTCSICGKELTDYYIVETLEAVHVDRDAHMVYSLYVSDGGVFILKTVEQEDVPYEINEIVWDHTH